MSKIRENLEFDDSALNCPEERDLAAWVVFTRLRPDGPFLYAGWLNAADEPMALDFAREHYGQDQPCDAILAIERRHLVGTDLAAPDDAPRDPGDWIVLVQDAPGDLYRTPDDEAAQRVTAATSREALDRARAAVGGDGVHGVWVAPASSLALTGENELIWRHVDQGYRLARGYSKEVRRKWETIRARKDVEAYLSEDLTEMFVDR